MAIFVTMRRTADDPTSATYEFGFFDEPPLGLMRVDKVTGTMELLRGDASAASKRAEWALAKCVQESAFPDALEWRS